MTKMVKVVNEEARAMMAFGEMMFGEGKELAFEGKLLVKNPTIAEYASISPEFEMIAEAGRADEVGNGVVYFDEKAERAFWIPEEDVVITEVH